MDELVDPGNPDDLLDLEKSLASGAFATVYQAKLAATGDVVAVKVVEFRAKEASEEMDDLLNEIIILKECNHPNIVKYIMSCRDANYFYIVMEMCTGASISQLYEVAGRSFTELQVQTVLHELVKVKF